MDCIDCHNVVAHRMSPTPEQAVDEAIAVGRITAGCPSSGAKAYACVKASYPTSGRGRGRDRRGAAEVLFLDRPRHRPRSVTDAVAALQTIYRRKCFLSMKVTFGTYPDNLGHLTSSGCFRCHDGSHNAKDGTRSARLRVLPQADRATLEDAGPPAPSSASTRGCSVDLTVARCSATHLEGLLRRVWIRQGIVGDAIPVRRPIASINLRKHDSLEIAREESAMPGDSDPLTARCRRRARRR